MKSFLFLSVLLITFGSCKKQGTGEEVIIPPVKEDSIPTTKYNLALLNYCDFFSKIPEVKSMTNQGYRELSGIVASQKNEGILYVHDDGSVKNIAITNKNGDDLGTLILNGMSFSDLEDIAVGPGPDASKSYIYLADIGDNNFKASSVTIYRFPEPILTQLNAPSQISITEFDKIKVSYAKGSANAETLMIDPLTKDIFILTKQSSKSYVYKASYPQSLSATTVLQPQAILNFDLLTGGDISFDGSEIIVRSTAQIWYWKRATGESIVQTLLKAPKDAPYAANEKQGEGICFSTNANGYFTDTEIQNHPGTVSTISFYKRVK